MPLNSVTFARKRVPRCTFRPGRQRRRTEEGCASSPEDACGQGFHIAAYQGETELAGAVRQSVGRLSRKPVAIGEECEAASEWWIDLSHESSSPGRKRWRRGPMRRGPCERP